jgi:hypothetical protein
VKVEGTLQEDGSILAGEIHVALPENAKSPGTVELIGTLEGQDGLTWTVSGIVVELTSTTEIKGSPEVGAIIKVEGTLQENGSILAVEIKLAGDDGNDDDSNHTNNPPKGKEVEFSGELSAMNGNTWTINGQTVFVTPMTELKGTLEIGVIVKVEGYLLEDGSIEAHQIKAVVIDMNGSDDDGEDDDHHSGSNYQDSDHQDDDHEDGDHQDSEHHDGDHGSDHKDSGGGAHEGGDD